MSKIAEEKALEAYPICNCYHEQCMMQEDVNLKFRMGYEEDYDQATQDLYDQDIQKFLEKACEWLKDNSKNYAVCYEDGYSHYAYNSMIDDFKNYIQNESKN